MPVLALTMEDGEPQEPGNSPSTAIREAVPPLQLHENFAHNLSLHVDLFLEFLDKRNLVRQHLDLLD